MSKKKKNQVLAEPPKNQVRCFKCGYTGPKDEVVIVGENGIKISNWHSTPADKYHPNVDPKPICNECAFKYREEFAAGFPWWFQYNKHLPSLAKTLEVIAQYRIRPVPVKPSPTESPMASLSNLRVVKVHALDKIRAKAQAATPVVPVIETPTPDDHHVTCSMCDCEGMDNEAVEVGKYGKKIEKFRSTPYDRNHPEVQPKPVCFSCWLKNHAKIREEYTWWFAFNDYLPTWVRIKEILAKHQAERQKEIAEQDRRMERFAVECNVKPDSELVCTRCGKHHGQVSVVSQVPFRKRMTLVDWVLIRPQTNEELTKNLCCNDCLDPAEKAFKYHEVINNVGKKVPTQTIRPEYLPKSVKDGTTRPWGSAARTMKPTGTNGR